PGMVTSGLRHLLDYSFIDTPLYKPGGAQHHGVHMSFRTKPYDTDTMPPGVPYIVSNEAAERFSYYGMKAILVVFMTEHLRNSAGQLAPMANAEAREYYHWFSSSVYFFPLIGALVADAFLGKYRTILW